MSDETASRLDPEDRLSAVCMFRLTQPEAELLYRVAAADGYSVSEWVRVQIRIVLDEHGRLS